MEKNAKMKAWFRKFGLWGFLFFLAKGLLWIALTYWIVQ
ncbi:MAG TPA: alanyl-tRNA synthetase [Chitinophagaceae bacterium]|nr:alanyl-tRNA synthetase [Chitinophagaceae bacterium]